MKGLVLLTLAAAMCTICGRPNTSNAEMLTSNPELRNAQLERRVQRLENEVNRAQRALEQFHHRISRLERDRDDDYRDPVPPQDVVHACIIMDTGFKRTFLGKASSQIDAKYEAKTKCEADVHDSYCKISNARCDSNLDDRRVKSYVCVVVDSGFNRAFRGEGQTAIEAEAKAKKNCEKDVHDSYCGEVRASCEPIYNR